MKRITIAAATLALAACGGGQSSTNNESAAANGAAADSAAPAAARAATGSRLPMQPGAWQSTITMDMPDAPPEVRAHLPANRTMTQRTCMTAETLDDANRTFLTGGSDQDGVHCDTTGMRIAGGRIEGVTVCTGPQGESMRMTMNGTLAANRYELDQQIEGPQGRITSHIVAQRVGDCTAEETAAANAGRQGAPATR